MTPKGWTISRRGNFWEITFENTRNMISITLTDAQASRFLGEFSRRQEAVT